MVNAREQLPATISEVDFGDRMKWVSGYLAQIESLGAIDSAINGEQLGGRLVNLRRDMLGVAAFATASTERLSVNPFGCADDTGKIIESSLAVFGKADAIIRDVDHQAANVKKAFKRNTRVFGLINEREQNLGNQMRNVPPATYVTQAIGQNHPVIDRRWTQVRAKIELFRHFTGQTDPEVTLGQSCDEEWAAYARNEFIFNIGRIQVAQVMLGPDCEQSAASFGIGQLLDICGMPPRLKEEEIGRQLEQTIDDTWMSNAQGVVDTIQRPYL